MIFVDKVKTGLKDVGKDCLIKNESILEILENVGGEHSNLAGYGILDIERTKLSWILLDWKVKVLKRPLYADELEVKTFLLLHFCTFSSISFCQLILVTAK